MTDRRTPTAAFPSAGYWHTVPDGPSVPADVVLRLAQERDHLFLLHEASAAAERVQGLEQKLRIFLAAVLRVGFQRGTISVRDASFDQTLLVASGLTAGQEAELRERPSPGTAWQRRFEQLEPYRVSYSYYLDATDPWIAREFGNAVPSSLPGREGSDWSPHDALLVPLRGIGGNLLGTLSVDDPADRARPTVEQVRTVELYAAQVAMVIERARMLEERDREQRLSGALADVARAVNESLQPAEVHHLIVRHARAILKCGGATLSLLSGGHVQCVAGAGTGAVLRGLRIQPTPLMEETLRTGIAAVSNDYLESRLPPEAAARTVRVQRAVVVPLVSRTGPIGVIAAFDRATPFTDSDAEFLQRMADQVAMAVVNATLFDEMATLAERYGRVVETTRDAIVITDRARAIVFTNPAADELFGIHPGVRPAVDRLVPPELRADVHEHETRALAGEPQRYESVIVRPDGERRLVVVATAPLYERGAITGIVATLRDITEERAARDALARSEAGYRNLFESATDAIYTVDQTGRFTSVNEATCRTLGATHDAIIGRAVREFIPDAEYERLRPHFRAAVEGEARRYECPFNRVDGTRRLLSVTNTPIRSGDVVVGVLGIARDVTDERARETALARSQARYTRLVESASDAIFTTDVDGRLLSVNRAMEKAVGVMRDALVGRSFSDLLDERDVPSITALLRETASGTRCQAQLRYRAASGSIRYGSLLATPIYEEGKLAGVLCIVRDVTEERRLSEQLLQQEKLAAVGELVSGVAHELNNPLAGVVAFSELLLAAPIAPEQRRAAETIHGEARRAARIVANLLTFARQHQPERALTDLNRIVESTHELRRYALRTLGIDVDLRLDPDLPLTWADPHQLQQVVVNLLVNAEHALSDWSGERRITIETASTDGVLRLAVGDSGPGIQAEHLSRIFNPFFTTKGVGRGTGLGLSISHGIVREHEGRISVQSRPGAGATFTVELPYVPPPARPPRTDTMRDVLAHPGRRLLIVDDEPSIRAAMCTFFESLEYVVDQAATGEDALAMLRRCAYDAILLDVRMPGVPGDEVYRRLRETAPDQAARVVFVTGDIQSDAVRGFLEAAGRPVLMKPFLLDDLAAAVEAMAAPA